MAKGPSTVLPFPDGIQDHWDLPQTTQPTPLQGGYHNRIVRMGDVVVRIEARTPESVAWEHELLAWLGAELPEVPVPIAAADGSTFLVAEAGVVSVLPFVEGSHRPGIEAAELLARVHVRGSAWPGARARPGRPAYANMDWERNDWWDWSVVAKPPELVRAFERTRAWVASEPPLVVTPIHGDPAQANAVWRGDRVVALLDWEWARLDWPALELAAAAQAFAGDDTAAFVAAYRAAGGPGEPEAVVEGERILVLANALYSLTQAAESGTPNRDWIDHLLARLRELA